MMIWIATANSGKLREFSTLLDGKFDAVHSQLELSFFTAPEENGTTFEENARIKALALKAVQQDVWVLGDDSGLEVDGLNQLPGVHSARYAGPKAQPSENTAKVLKMLQLRSPQNRVARFCSVLIALSPEGVERRFEGVLHGEIARKQRGTGGFGYDDIFIPEGRDKTLAEMSLAEKNRLSHRALATRAFLESLTH